MILECFASKDLCMKTCLWVIHTEKNDHYKLYNLHPICYLNSNYKLNLKSLGFNESEGILN